MNNPFSGTPVNAVVIRDALEVVAEYGIPARGQAWITDVGTEGFLKFFNDEILDDLVTRGASTCRLFEAPYGAGKTHLLDLIESAAVFRGMPVVRAELSDSLKFEDWKQVTQHILQAITFHFDGRAATGLPNVLGLARDATSADSSRLATRLPHPGFQRAISLILDRGIDSVPQVVHRFLLGEKVRVADIRAAGVRNVTDALSVRNAEQVVSTVVSAFQMIGLPGTLVLFDENEKTLDSGSLAPSRRVQMAANVIRRFIDGCFNGQLSGLLAVFAVLPGFLGRCAQAYAALGQRLRQTKASLEFEPWRWPTLQLRAISGTDHNSFRSRAVDRMLELAEACGVETADGLGQKLLERSGRILKLHAGTGFKRPLMKELCASVLKEMNT